MTPLFKQKYISSEIRTNIVLGTEIIRKYEEPLQIQTINQRFVDIVDNDPIAYNELKESLSNGAQPNIMINDKPSLVVIATKTAVQPVRPNRFGATRGLNDEPIDTSMSILTDISRGNKYSPFNVNKTTLAGSTALMFNIVNQYGSGVDILLQRFAGTNIKNNRGYTALHYTASIVSDITPIIIQKLLDYGADKLVKNNAGETPYDLAIKYNNSLEVRNLLFDILLVD